MRRMYDSIDAASVPSDGDVYLGYDDGHWPDASELAQRFPGKLVLRCTVFPGDDVGDVGDCETGDMTPQQLPQWVARRRFLGHPNPVGYCSFNAWASVRGEFLLQNVPPPPYIIADADGIAVLPALWLSLGAVGKQYGFLGAYDVSILVNFIPGIDRLIMTPDETADFVRSLIIDYWGREPTVAEQQFSEGFCTTNGKDLTRASLYDHANGAAFRAKRGW